jgi:hypothetical protein
MALPPIIIPTLPPFSSMPPIVSPSSSSGASTPQGLKREFGMATGIMGALSTVSMGIGGSIGYMAISMPDLFSGMLGKIVAGGGTLVPVALAAFTGFKAVQCFKEYRNASEAARAESKAPEHQPVAP